MDRHPRESCGCSGVSLLQEVGTHPIGRAVWYTPEDIKTMRAGPNEVNIRPASTQRTSAYNPGQWPKALEDYVINNPLPLGDRWNIVKMSGDEFKVQAVESVMYLHAKAYDYGSDGVIVSVVGRGLDGKSFKKQISHNDKLIGKLTTILQGLAKSMQKTAGGSVEAGVGIDNTKTAASFPSYNPVQTLALSRVKDRAKAARMRAKAIKAVEEALRVVRGSDSQNMKYLVDRAEADLQRIKRMPETSDLYQLITDTSTLNDHFSRLRWEASQLGLREAKMVAHRQNAVPADVKRYVEEVRAANPDYDDAKVWATAWSIYCAHKNPDSEHCKKPTDEYFPGRSASDKALRARVIRLAHENRSLRASLIPLLSEDERIEKAKSVIVDVVKNHLSDKIADLLSRISPHSLKIDFFDSEVNAGTYLEGWKTGDTPDGMPFAVSTVRINGLLPGDQWRDPDLVKSMMSKIPDALAPLKTAFRSRGIGIELSDRNANINAIPFIRCMVYVLDGEKPKFRLASTGNGDPLQADLIRLAHTNPALRPHLLPLITGSGKNDRYNQAIIEAAEKANQLKRPVEVRKNALGGYSVNLFMMDRKTGLPTEAVRGEIIKPGHPLSVEQKRLKDMKTASTSAARVSQLGR